jgi:hypothetical protein
LLGRRRRREFDLQLHSLRRLGARAWRRRSVPVPRCPRRMSIVGKRARARRTSIIHPPIVPAAAAVVGIVGRVRVAVVTTMAVPRMTPMAVAAGHLNDQGALKKPGRISTKTGSGAIPFWRAPGSRGRLES